MTETLTGILNHWILQVVTMMLTALAIPGLRITSIFGAVRTVVVLALVNATVWDAALFFSVPSGLSSQVLVLLFANGALFWILVKVLPGIEVDGVLPALVAPIVFTVLSVVITAYGRDIDFVAIIGWAIGKIGELREYLLDAGSSQPTGP